jgi:hypothetical protein
VLLFRKNPAGVETQVLSTMPSLKGLFIGEVKNVDEVVEELVATVEDIVAQFNPTHIFAGVTSWFRTTTGMNMKCFTVPSYLCPCVSGLLLPRLCFFVTYALRPS